VYILKGKREDLLSFSQSVWANKKIKRRKRKEKRKRKEGCVGK